MLRTASLPPSPKARWSDRECRRRPARLAPPLATPDRFRGTRDLSALRGRASRRAAAPRPPVSCPPRAPVASSLDGRFEPRRRASARSHRSCGGRDSRLVSRHPRFRRAAPSADEPGRHAAHAVLAPNNRYAVARTSRRLDGQARRASRHRQDRTPAVRPHAAAWKPLARNRPSILSRFRLDGTGRGITTTKDDSARAVVPRETMSAA